MIVDTLEQAIKTFLDSPVETKIRVTLGCMLRLLG